MLPQHAEQLLTRDELLPHVRGESRPVANHWNRVGISPTFQTAIAKSEPIEEIVPENDREDQSESVEDRSVLAGHCVLRGIRNENHHQEVGNTEVPGSLRRTRISVKISK